ncbi:MAG: SDR family oxidoreductase [Phycisphaeraceae bacterium]|nr:MAG: SDR family oxidoreductase [Phycisphaeraceae bacterium]
MSARPLAFVTGGARRVGAAIVDALARSGCDVVVHHHASVGEAEAVASRARALGVDASVWRQDLSDPGAVDVAAAELASGLPRLDVLVHNASVYEPTPLGSLTPARALHIHAVNALAPLILTRRLSGLLSASPMRGGGSVVALLDIHAMGRPRRDFSAYAMSKAALGEMVRSLARDLAPKVRVNGIAPGVVAWPESGPEADASFQGRYLDRVPLARAGSPEDAAGAVVWLALGAPYVTGEIVRVDGGRSLA